MAKRATLRQKTISQPAVRDEGLFTKDYAFPEWKLRLFRAAIIVALGFWIYWPAMYGDWLWDDLMYISQNPLMKDPARIWKAWFEPGTFVEYYPIEQSLQWIQWQLWGNNTFWYHLTNVVLHLLNAFLIWRLLSKFGLKLGWLGGLIFAVHPMNVESVAWISEFKNTLSLAPFLMAMCTWIDYEERGRTADYWQTVGWFLVSMLCKIGVAPFPFVLLLYAWWKRGRIGGRDVLASVPFFVISLVLSFITEVGCLSYMHSQLKNMAVVEMGGFFWRLALAGQSIAFYFSRVFWPVDPMPDYYHWKVDPTAPLQFLPWVAMAGVAYYLWQRRQTWGRHALLALGFFIMLLGPFLGFLNISYMCCTWVYDHFLYVPMIGLIVLVVAAIENLDTRIPATIHPVGTGLLTVLIGLLAFESHWYAAAFTSDETLWTYAVDRNPQAWIAHDDLGKILLAAGETEQARQHFETVIQLVPDLGEPYMNLGTTYAEEGKMPEAIDAFHLALKNDPYSPEAHNDLGIILAQKGETAEALSHFEQALRGHPTYVEAHNNMGNTLMLVGRLPEAIAQFQTAVLIDPKYVAGHDNLGLALAKAGRGAEAVEQFQTALALDPDDAKARDALATLEQAAPAPDKK